MKSVKGINNNLHLPTPYRHQKFELWLLIKNPVHICFDTLQLPFPRRLALTFIIGPLKEDLSCYFSVLNNAAKKRTFHFGPKTLVSNNMSFILTL